MKSLFLFFSMWLFACSLWGQDLLLENAQLVDPESQTISEGVLWIRAGKIHQRLASAPDDFVGERVDLKGKYLLPSLLDLHTHSWGNMGVGGNMEMLMTDKTAQRMMYSGVGAFLDLFSEENSIFALRDQQRATGLPGADIFCAGPILTCKGGHGTEYGIPTRLINNPDQARTVVADLAQKKPDVIKIVYDNAEGRMPTIDKATLTAAIEASAAVGIKTVIHIGTWQDILDALEAGASAITHLPGEPMPAEAPALFVEKNAVIIPTLTVESDLTHILGNESILNSELLAGAASPLVIDSYRDTDQLDPRTSAFLAFQKAATPHLGPAILALHQAGVPILVGTDAGNPGVIQGYSVHREMALLAEAGMDTWSVLAGATSAAADFLGQDYGLQTGDLANLLVLSANPLEDLAHVEQIERMLHHGQWVDRAAMSLSEITTSQRTEAKIDDFNAGIDAWTAMSDEVQGGLSTLEIEEGEGTMRVKGALKIGDKMPFAWVQLSRMLTSQGAAEDLNGFEGVRIRYKLPAGNVYFSLMDSRIQNFDYHAAFLKPGTEWQELEIPFTSLQQNFTQPPLVWNGEKILGLAIGSSGPMPAGFELEIDWIEFY